MRWIIGIAYSSWTVLTELEDDNKQLMVSLSVGRNTNKLLTGNTLMISIKKDYTVQRLHSLF